MEHINSQEIQQNSPERGSIAELVELAKSEGHNVKEVAVWNHGGVNVPNGEVGVVPTEALNGCHVSIITAEFPDGQKTVNMTHYPPELGARRYIESLEEIQRTIVSNGGKAETIVTLIASDRGARETQALKELFPDIEPVALTYKARDKQRRSSPDAGRCVAVLDRRDAARQTLHIATDSGDIVLAA